MDPIAIAVVQFSFNVLVWTLIARWYVAPRLAKLPLHVALVPPMLIHGGDGGGVSRADPLRQSRPDVLAADAPASRDVAGGSVMT